MAGTLRIQPALHHHVQAHHACTAENAQEKPCPGLHQQTECKTAGRTHCGERGESPNVPDVAYYLWREAGADDIAGIVAGHDESGFNVAEGSKCRPHPEQGAQQTNTHEQDRQAAKENQDRRSH